MSVELFRDDDRGYTAWLTENTRGYVLNIQRSMNPSDARVHKVACRTITGMPPRGRTWTGPYVKACSPSLTELYAWALSHAESAITSDEDAAADQADDQAGIAEATDEATAPEATVPEATVPEATATEATAPEATAAE